MNEKLNVITFEFVLQKLKNKTFVILTLGGKSKFTVNKVKNFIFIKNSGDNTFRVDNEHWDKVMDRVKVLPNNEKGMTSRYSKGQNSYNWEQCPNRIFTPYIPAIVKYFNS